MVKAQAGGWKGLSDIAERFHAANDYRAAAVYARAAFEVWVKKRAEKEGGVKVQFKLNPAQLTSDELWNALYAKVTTPTADQVTAKNNLELARKIVLNPWSHGGGNAVTAGEVGAAINAVKEVADKFAKLNP